jgi:hypothetical protein
MACDARGRIAQRARMRARIFQVASRGKVGTTFSLVHDGVSRGMLF